MEQSRKQLVEDNISLAYYIVHKHGLYKDDEEIAEAENALVEAALNFDISKNVKFATYAATCIRLKIITFNSSKRHLIHFRNKSNYCHEEHLSLDIKCEQDDGSDISILDILQKDKGINEDSIIEKVYLKEFWSKLSTQEQQILYMRAMGSTQNEIAEELKLSQVHISRLLIKLRNKYKEY